MLFITSWDDGHPSDYRLAELLSKFHLKSTFFIPINNREGRPVLSNAAMRDLDREFEIASHTLDHFNLTKLLQNECRQQIVDGKTELEHILGHSVNGFCYPRGKWNSLTRQNVIEAGFTYARTTENLWLSDLVDNFLIPTTIQFFPHKKKTIIKNYIRYGNYGLRFKCLAKILNATSWFDSLLALIDEGTGNNSIVHVWGHSWEIEENSLWKQLELFFHHVIEKQPIVCTLNELITDEQSRNQSLMLPK